MTKNSSQALACVIVTFQSSTNSHESIAALPSILWFLRYVRRRRHPVNKRSRWSSRAEPGCRGRILLDNLALGKIVLYSQELPSGRPNSMRAFTSSEVLAPEIRQRKEVKGFLSLADHKVHHSSLHNHPACFRPLLNNDAGTTSGSYASSSSPHKPAWVRDGFPPEQ